MDAFLENIVAAAEQNLQQRHSIINELARFEENWQQERTHMTNQLDRVEFMITHTRHFIQDSLNRDRNDLASIRNLFQETTELINEGVRVSFPNEPRTPLNQMHTRNIPPLIRQNTSNVPNTNTNFNPRRRIIFEENPDLENRRMSRTQSQHKCKCPSTNFVLDGETLDECPICNQSNTIGIKPDCCNKKQMICLNCIHKTFLQEYQKITRQDPTQEANKDKLFDYHYTCSFCREVSCYKKYMFLFDE